MALVMYFSPQGMDDSKYEETLKELEAVGQGAPAGRIYHLAFGEKKNLRVIDIWESEEAFNAFGQTLMPILEKLGIDPGQPEITEVQNIIKG